MNQLVVTNSSDQLMSTNSSGQIASLSESASASSHNFLNYNNEEEQQDEESEEIDDESKNQAVIRVVKHSIYDDDDNNEEGDEYYEIGNHLIHDKLNMGILYCDTLNHNNNNTASTEFEAEPEDYNNNQDDDVALVDQVNDNQPNEFLQYFLNDPTEEEEKLNVNVGSSSSKISNNKPKFFKEIPQNQATSSKFNKSNKPSSKRRPQLQSRQIPKNKLLINIEKLHQQDEKEYQIPYLSTEYSTKLKNLAENIKNKIFSTNLSSFDNSFEEPSLLTSTSIESSTSSTMSSSFTTTTTATAHTKNISSALLYLQSLAKEECLKLQQEPGPNNEIKGNDDDGKGNDNAPSSFTSDNNQAVENVKEKTTTDPEINLQNPDDKNGHDPNLLTVYSTSNDMEIEKSINNNNNNDNSTGQGADSPSKKLPSYVQEMMETDESLRRLVKTGCVTISQISTTESSSPISANEFLSSSSTCPPNNSTNQISISDNVSTIKKFLSSQNSTTFETSTNWSTFPSAHKLIQLAALAVQEEGQQQQDKDKEDKIQIKPIEKINKKMVSGKGSANNNNKISPIQRSNNNSKITITTAKKQNNNNNHVNQIQHTTKTNPNKQNSVLKMSYANRLKKLGAISNSTLPSTSLLSSSSSSSGIMGYQSPSILRRRPSLTLSRSSSSSASSQSFHSNQNNRNSNSNADVIPSIPKKYLQQLPSNKLKIQHYGHQQQQRKIIQPSSSSLSSSLSLQRMLQSGGKQPGIFNRSQEISNHSVTNSKHDGIYYDDDNDDIDEYEDEYYDYENDEDMEEIPSTSARSINRKQQFVSPSSAGDEFDPTRFLEVSLQEDGMDEQQYDDDDEMDDYEEDINFPSSLHHMNNNYSHSTAKASTSSYNNNNSNNIPSSLSDEQAQRRKYKCTYCHKAFCWSTDLKRHILTHTGERPFVCTYCSASFTRKFLMQKHIKKFHSPEPQSSNANHHQSSSGSSSSHIINNSATKTLRRFLAEATTNGNSSSSSSSNLVNDKLGELLDNGNSLSNSLVIPKLGLNCKTIGGNSSSSSLSQYFLQNDNISSISNCKNNNNNNNKLQIQQSSSRRTNNFLSPPKSNNNNNNNKTFTSMIGRNGSTTNQQQLHNSIINQSKINDIKLRLLQQKVRHPIIPSIHKPRSQMIYDANDFQYNNNHDDFNDDDEQEEMQLKEEYPDYYNGNNHDESNSYNNNDNENGFPTNPINPIIINISSSKNVVNSGGGVISSSTSSKNYHDSLLSSSSAIPGNSRSSIINRPANKNNNNNIADLKIESSRINQSLVKQLMRANAGITVDSSSSTSPRNSSNPSSIKTMMMKPLVNGKNNFLVHHNNNNFIAGGSSTSSSSSNVPRLKR